MDKRRIEVKADRDFKQNWDTLRLKLKIYFDMLSDEDIEFIDGKRELLIGKLMAYYKWDFDYASNLVNKFIYLNI